MTMCEQKRKLQGHRTSSLSAFLTDLFLRIDRNDVRYCVLRNYGGLPEVVENDIDIFVHPSHVSTFRRILVGCAYAHGFCLVKHPARYGWEQFWFVSESSDVSVEIDVLSNLYWKGATWISTENVLRGRRPFRQFFVPSEPAEAVILLLKDLIYGFKVRSKYREAIRRTLTKAPDAVHRCLADSVGREFAAQLLSRVDAEDWDAIERSCRHLRRIILRRSVRRPMSMLVGLLRFSWGHLRARLGASHGFFVVLIGPDGSGKSTTAEALAEALQPLFRTRDYYHGRFEILPRLKDIRDRLLRRDRRKTDAATDDGSEPPAGSLRFGRGRALIHVLYYSLDFFLGHRIVSRSGAMGHLIVFDRYFYDWYIQTQFGRAPAGLFHILRLFLPRPDLLVHLYNDPEVIHARKPELTVAEIEAQNQKCLQIVDLVPRAVTVNTDSSVDQVIAQIREQMLAVMKARFRAGRT